MEECGVVLNQLPPFWPTHELKRYVYGPNRKGSYKGDGPDSGPESGTSRNRLRGSLLLLPFINGVRLGKRTHPLPQRRKELHHSERKTQQYVMTS